MLSITYWFAPALISHAHPHRACPSREQGGRGHTQSLFSYGGNSFSYAERAMASSAFESASSFLDLISEDLKFHVRGRLSQFVCKG